MKIFSFIIVAFMVTPLYADKSSAADKFFNEYCISCHGPKKKKGGLRIDELSRDFSKGFDAHKWHEIMGTINSGEMPPEDEEKRPSEKEMGQIVGWINSELKKGQAVRMARRGPVAHYRLSRDEYAQTVYDLLGVHYDPARPGNLNEDPDFHGFRRLGSMLSLSPSHIQRYFGAAETVLNRAYPANTYKYSKKTTRGIDHHHTRNKAKKLGILDEAKALLWPGSHMAYRIGKKEGLFRFKLKVSGLTTAQGEIPHLTVWDNKTKQSVFDTDVIAPEGKPATVEFELFMPLNSVYEFKNVGKSLRTGHTLNVSRNTIFTHSKDHRYIAKTGHMLFDDEGRALYPMLIIEEVEVEGPIVTDEVAAKRASFFPQTEDLNEIKSKLKYFAFKAWRRPPHESEISRYLKIYETEKAAGENHRSAYLAAMTGVLTSKNFYYIVEGSHDKKRDYLNDYELATRLSYFLWNSMPDDELLKAAAEGTLKSKDQLAAQLSRVMNDKKIEQFADSFSHQWLRLHQVGMFPPDKKLFPTYDSWLETSMILEPKMFFKEMLRNNLEFKNFLDSNWTMVNPRLAKFYGFDDLNSSGFQKVKLKPEYQRGGLLTQAAVLSLSSDGTRHRPVHRGVWVSEVIIGKVPPPPPANVDPIQPNPVKAPKASIRMKLEAHAKDPNCSSCHKKIDPYGFAFDNYDAIGQWRLEEYVAKGKGPNPKVNASGEIFGKSFKGPQDFKKLLIEDEDKLALAFIEHLATYALRRTMTFADEDALHKIAAEAKKNDYRLRNIIEAFVLSDLFKKR